MRMSKSLSGGSWEPITAMSRNHARLRGKYKAFGSKATARLDAVEIGSRHTNKVWRAEERARTGAKTSTPTKSIAVLNELGGRRLPDAVRWEAGGGPKRQPIRPRTASYMPERPKTVKKSLWGVDHGVVSKMSPDPSELHVPRAGGGKVKPPKKKKGKLVPMG